jgi:hypothetical protein
MKRGFATAIGLILIGAGLSGCVVQPPGAIPARRPVRVTGRRPISPDQINHEKLNGVPRV